MKRSHFLILGIQIVLVIVLILGAPLQTYSAEYDLNSRNGNSTRFEVDGKSQPIQPGEIPTGLSSAEWMRIQDTITADQYRFSRKNTTANAHNVTQGWELTFDENGLSVTPANGDAWNWGLQLTGYGYDPENLRGFDARDSLRALRKNATGLTTDTNTLTYYWDENISEWWINQATGLEQGFTVQERPQYLTPDTQSPLVLEMAVTGNLSPVQHGNTIHFQNPAGETILTYDKLLVIDAKGQTISARLSLFQGDAKGAFSPKAGVRDNFIQILVQDAHAAYPLTIDPWVETTILRASNVQSNANFGHSVSISGDTLVVGAPYEDGASSDVGAAYVFERDQGGTGNWGQVKKLYSSDGQEYGNFGTAVSISGDTLVVGAPYEDGASSDVGAAYVFERDQGGADNWGQVKALHASDAQGNDYFGHSVSISGDTVVVGSFGEDGGSGDPLGNSGAAYVLER